MRSYRVMYACLFAILFLLGLTGVTQAQPPRVFVSAQRGDDANACENVQTPCLTFQGAVNQVAARGTVLVLDSGDYRPVRIDKSLSIVAPPGVAANWKGMPPGSSAQVKARPLFGIVLSRETSMAFCASPILVSVRS